jgi:hypothetical protein
MTGIAVGVDHLGAEPRTKVLYLIGWGRSGSTLIDNLVGETKGFFSTGELRNLWQEGLEQGRRCGCGELVLDCPVWSSVLQSVFGTIRAEEIYSDRILEWQKRNLRTRRTWRVLSNANKANAELEAYTTVMERVYRSVAEVTGSRVIVDSSKVPSDAAMLLSIPSIDAYYIHLVRDPRATAFSWQRKKARLDGGSVEDMPRFSLVKNAFSWNEFNLGAEAVERKAGAHRFKRTRYEDFVEDPRGTIKDIVEFVGEEPVNLPFSDQRMGTLGVNHTVSGNPSRFKRGEIVIRADNEWIRRQASSLRWATTFMTLPFLRRYKYSVSLRADDPAADEGAIGRPPEDRD